MEDAAGNAPLFLEAYYDACEAIRRWPGKLSAPDVGIINEICGTHGIGYEIKPPALLLRDANARVISVPERPSTLDEKASEILTESLRHSEELLQAGRGREAVQEALWLLETVATAFRGMETGSGKIGGRYFNQVLLNSANQLTGRRLIASSIGRPLFMATCHHQQAALCVTVSTSARVLSCHSMKPDCSAI